MSRLSGKTALITGAGRGLGKAFATRYLEEGATVMLADINLPAVTEAAKELGSNAHAVEMNVAEQASIEAAVAETIRTLGHIDILINNAAVFEAAPIADITRESYDKLFSINVAGTLFTLQAVAKHMIDRGQGGRIINMASQAGRRGESLVAVYCATKAAVISLTQSAALNLAPHGINVNAIAPGVIDDTHWDGVDAYFAKLEGLQPGEKKKQVFSSVPLGRAGKSEDHTGMAVFLASEDANYITAQTYNVDGGNWMS